MRPPDPSAVQQGLEQRPVGIHARRSRVGSHMRPALCLYAVIAGPARLEQMRAGAIHFSALALCILRKSPSLRWQQSQLTCSTSLSAKAGHYQLSLAESTRALPAGTALFAAA
jgi:hypothetical protein